MSRLSFSFRFVAPVLGMLAVAAGCFNGPDAGGEDVEAAEGALQAPGAFSTLKGKTVLIVPFAYRSFQPEWRADRPQDGWQWEAAPSVRNPCLSNNAEALLKWYGERGVDMSNSKVLPVGTAEGGVSWEILLAALEAEKDAGRTYDRVVTVGRVSDGMMDLMHRAYNPFESSGNGDGGVSDGDPEVDHLAELRGDLIKFGSLLNAITKPKAFVYLGSFEGRPVKLHIDPAYNFVQLTACLSGRSSFGAATTSSCEDAVARVKRIESAHASNMLKEGDPSHLPVSQAEFTCVAP